MQKITLIAACAQNGCIGINNTMPWHLPEDFAFFRAYTTGKPVIMGRKTWESLPKKPLPGRRNIVITRQADYIAEGAETTPSLKDALAKCADAAEIMIIGGAQIYAEALSVATDLRITEVDLKIDGDAFFPPIGKEWQIKNREQHTAANGTVYAFVHYEKPNSI
ncbi:dihydrofolate reductase [Neisseria zalophi]|uniref:Dihydrofolate reductase n=1 Tax=Neisseria zalophi TaxID=640030 RepID=A0A5J6PSR8_9NEIS|nr:dihydrofolate reductase [Neisseria zalophi]QEY25344.1 dihydrofolate reductase [Neisseria zalophi]